jgi:drug/metabolite transporter (DMT)-like permease
LYINKRQAILIVLLALVGYASTSVTLFLSYDYISVGLATTIHFLYPIIVTVASFFIYKEKIDFKKLLALLISILGMYLLVAGGNISLDMRGILFSFVSAIFYSIYILGVSEPEVKKINTYVSIFYVFMISSIAILTLIFFKNGGKIALNITSKGIVSVFFIAFISTVVALAMFVKGIQVVGPSAASILSTFEPIVSIILGTLILKEVLNFNMVFGCVLILISVIILTVSNSKNLA